MRTTVELPDDLFRKAKARAAMQGRALKDLVAEGLTLVLRTPVHSPVPSGRTRFPLIEPKDRTRRVTPQMVAEAEEQLLSEEAADHGRVAGH
jgi:hypothetical protein